MQGGPTNAAVGLPSGVVPCGVVAVFSVLPGPLSAGAAAGRPLSAVPMPLPDVPLVPTVVCDVGGVCAHGVDGVLVDVGDGAVV